MKTDTLRFRDLLQRDIRLLVPLFQRPYVWNQRDQWEPFWEDIRGIAEGLLNKHLRRPHFLGAIVLEQVPTGSGDVDQRLVIDGQQRLTTSQIVLEAFHDLCFELGASKPQSALEKMTRIDDPMIEAETDLYKVWPTAVDQPAYRLIMECETQGDVLEAIKEDDDLADRPIIKGYLYFIKTIRDWLSLAEDDEGRDNRINCLLAALRDHMRFVVIDLESEDDSQLIFETLNARGTPLLPTDLVKNFIFYRARMEGLNLENLYQKHWLYFDEWDDWWRKQIGRGHAQRARIDLFLQAFLTIKTRADVPVTHVYSICRDYVIDSNIEAESFLTELRTYGEIFGEDLQESEDAVEDSFICALDALDVLSVTPVAMELFHRLKSKKETLRAVLRDIESFLVRRMVCGLNTRGYNYFFVDMLDLVGEDETTADRIREYLLKSDSESARWPNDEEFKAAWLKAPIYRTLVRKRVRLLLESIEYSLRGPKTEEIVGTLQVEHLLPQKWHQHWPLPGDESEEVETANRNGLLHSIGNLSLVTKSLNPSLSNAAWQTKRAEILKHSALSLNRVFSEIDDWNEDAITERAKTLFKTAKDLWKFPNP